MDAESIKKQIEDLENAKNRLNAYVSVIKTAKGDALINYVKNVDAEIRSQMIINQIPKETIETQDVQKMDQTINQIEEAKSETELNKILKDANFQTDALKKITSNVEGNSEIRELETKLAATKAKLAAATAKKTVSETKKNAWTAVITAILGAAGAIPSSTDKNQIDHFANSGYSTPVSGTDTTSININLSSHNEGTGQTFPTTNSKDKREWWALCLDATKASSYTSATDNKHFKEGEYAKELRLATEKLDEAITEMSALATEIPELETKLAEARGKSSGGGRSLDFYRNYRRRIRQRGGATSVEQFKHDATIELLRASTLQKLTNMFDELNRQINNWKTTLTTVPQRRQQTPNQNSQDFGRLLAELIASKCDFNNPMVKRLGDLCLRNQISTNDTLAILLATNSVQIADILKRSNHFDYVMFQNVLELKKLIGLSSIRINYGSAFY